MNEGLLNYDTGVARQRNIPQTQKSKQPPPMRPSASSQVRTDSQRELETFGFKGVPYQTDDDGWGAVSNLDVFFGNMYFFYQNRGMATILTTGISNTITLAFTVIFSTFLFSFIHWNKLWECRDETSCAPNAHDYIRDPFQNAGFLDAMVFIWFILFSLYWLWTVVLFIASTRDASEMDRIFKEKLNISNKELQTIEWHEVVSRLEALQRSGKYTIAINSPKGGFTARDIACRIMRKENYLIAMLNKGVLPLQLPFPKWPPPPIKKLLNCFLLDSDGDSDDEDEYAADYHMLPSINEDEGDDDEEHGNSRRKRNNMMKRQKKNKKNTNIKKYYLDDSEWLGLSKRSYFTTTLEWAINVCLLTHIHDESFTVNPEFIKDVSALKRRFFRTGCVYIALMPFVLVFMVIHFFLKNAQEWHTKKNYLGPRQWDHLALWHFREFNELPHVFERRLSLSYEHAGKYTRRFHSPALAVVARAVSFISGSFIGVLLLLTVVDDDAFLFHVTLNDHNLLWHLGILSAIFAVSRGFAGEPPDEAVMDADEMMGRVAEHTHYFPESWRGQCASHVVRDEFMSIFKFKAMLFLEEILVVLLAPYVLCIAMPEHSENILAFVQEHTVDVDGLGSVCAFSLFDFSKYGDERYAAPVKDGDDPNKKNKKRPDRTEQGKLEKSFLNFKMNHPDWQCDADGEAFLQNLCDFQERELVARRTQQAASMLASQMHVNEILQSSMLRQSQHAQQFEMDQSPDLTKNITSSESEQPPSSGVEVGNIDGAGEATVDNVNESMDPSQKNDVLNSNNSFNLQPPARMSRISSFPTIPENTPETQHPQPQPSPVSLTPPRISMNIQQQQLGSRSPPPFAEPESPLGRPSSLSSMDQFGLIGSGSVGGGVGGGGLGGSDLALSSILASLNNTNTASMLARSINNGAGLGGSLYGVGGMSSMRNEPRTVEALLQSAMREESLSNPLRDSVYRKPSSNNQLLDSTLGASIYWLDQHRSKSNNLQSASSSSTLRFGESMRGGGFSAGSGSIGFSANQTGSRNNNHGQNDVEAGGLMTPPSTQTSLDEGNMFYNQSSTQSAAAELGEFEEASV